MPRGLAPLIVWLSTGTSFLSIGVCSASAQTRLTSLAALRSELAAGDVVTVVPALGPPLSGRLMRLGDDELAIRLDIETVRAIRGARDVTIRFDDIRSLERRRDAVQNGATMGACVGAAYGGAMFVHALIVDRNEIDEWADFYAGFAAVSTGIGALVGWAIDARRSKPHIRFDAPSEEPARFQVQPLLRRGGLALAVSFSP
jgi:hypothetical protein